MNDKTKDAIHHQLDCMQVKLLDIGIKKPGGHFLCKKWTHNQLLDDKCLRYLKWKNFDGYDIYARPDYDKNQGLILVDDVDTAKIEQMQSRGMQPCCMIESSPGNYQVLVRVSDAPIDNPIATLIAQLLAKEFGGDQAADWRHYFRLAGFTNRKPEHKTGHYAPWVLIHDCMGLPAQKGPDLIAWAKRRHAKIKVMDRNMPNRIKILRNKVSPNDFFISEAKRLVATYGFNTNYSQLDWMIATDMLSRGYTRSQVQDAMIRHSPRLNDRKPSHQIDYVKRTVNKAFVKFFGAGNS